MTTSRMLIAGNWKMNGLRASLTQIAAVNAAAAVATDIDVAIFPPATLLAAAATLVTDSPLTIGAQDCHTGESGAFTGDISAAMLKDAGANAVILGHSERRSGHGETSRIIAVKASAALRAGLRIILCVGETAGERTAGLAEQVCARQLAESMPAEASAQNVAIAYEPVWAIGTGLSPTLEDIGAIHHALRQRLAERPAQAANGGWRILYGGSVGSANATPILGCADVDGVLVGGASLNSASFAAIMAAAVEVSKKRQA